MWTAEKVTTIVTARARRGVSYAVRFACLATDQSTTGGYKVVSTLGEGRQDEVASAADIACNGEETSDSGTLEGTNVQVDLSDDLTGVTTAYAILVPADE